MNLRKDKSFRLYAAAILLFTLSGCARLFGWDIHAPGLLSARYFQQVQPAPYRVALYMPRDLLQYQVKDRGSKFADPQTFYIGEALAPMALEAFQQGFREFVLMEAEPDEDLMRRYEIDYLVALQPGEFKNLVTLKGQKVKVILAAEVYNRQMQPLGSFTAEGSSEAQKVFAKKGGPEINLNAAIENALSATVHYLQDSFRRLDGAA